MAPLTDPEVTVDLSMWKKGARALVVVDDTTTTGELVAELIDVLGLPRRAPGGAMIEHSLAVGGAVLDPTANVLASATDGPAALRIGPGAIGSVVDRLPGEIAVELRSIVDAEIQRWLERGRAIVLGATSQATSEIRDSVARRVMDHIEGRGNRLLDHHRARRALRRLARERFGVGYADAIRTGLERSREGLGGARAVLAEVAGWAGSVGAGGVGAAATSVGVVLAATVFVAVSLSDAGAWHSDEGPPWADLGREGDLYLDTASQEAYKKADDGWRMLFTLKGDPGPPGRTGKRGPQGDDGQMGPAGTTAQWSHGTTARDAADGQDGDFHLDICTGVVTSKIQGEWSPVVDLAGTLGPLREPDCVTATVRSADTLWGLVVNTCPELTTNAERARAVAETWLANLDVIGGDPDTIDLDQRLVVRCS